MEIKAYKTTDGTVFEDKSEAETHQARLDLGEALGSLIKDVFCYGITEYELTRDLIEEIDKGKGEDLLKALKKYLED